MPSRKMAIALTPEAAHLWELQSKRRMAGEPRQGVVFLNEEGRSSRREESALFVDK